jgi:hypothetical protein
MREWRLMLGAFAVWAVHFVLVYGVASIADISDPTQGPAWRTAGLALTVACLAALPLICLRARSGPAVSPLARQLGTAGCVLSFVAIAWQSLPLLISG